MNSTIEQAMTVEGCRTALQAFWNEVSAIEASRDGIVMALPVSYPDGWQVVVALRQISKGHAVISDRGQTLMRLSEMGVNVDPKAKGTYQIFEQRKKAFGIIQEGFELKSDIKLPLEGADVQLFAESLLSIAYLTYRHEAAEETDLATVTSVRRLFHDHNLKPKENHALDGAVEKRIRVDFYLPGKRSLAIQAVKRRGQILGYMEQWAWRWTDLQSSHPDLLRAMVYDPDQQEWDHTSLEIGRRVCDVFCPYFEKAVIDEAIRKCA